MILIQILTACWFGYALYTWNLSGFWYFLTNIQLIGFIPMTAVNFPRLGTLILRNMLNYIFIPNVFKWFISKDTHEFNKFTLRNGFESSLIILNVGCLLIAFILLLLVYPVLKMDKDLPFFAKMLNEYK